MNSMDDTQIDNETEKLLDDSIENFGNILAELGLDANFSPTVLRLYLTDVIRQSQGIVTKSFVETITKGMMKREPKMPDFQNLGSVPKNGPYL